MILSDFYSLVSTSLKRGTALDAIIPQYTKIAHNWLERNYTMHYMKVYRLLQVEQEQRTVLLPTNAKIKSIRFVRLVDKEGYYFELHRVDPRDVNKSETRKPTGYWLSGISHIVFDNKPDIAYAGDSQFIEFTSWPEDTTHTHPLLEFASDALLYETLKHMAGYLRDADMVASYKLLRDESLDTLTRAEDELNYDGASLNMAYIPPHS